jgi:hypothetical protein
MTSIYGCDPSYDIRTQYSIKDICGKLPIPRVNQNTILEFLINEPICFQFTDLILKIDQISGILNDTQTSCTLLVPLHIMNEIDPKDKYRLRQFLSLHILEKCVSYDFLTSSRGQLLNTRLTGTRIYCQNRLENLDGIRTVYLNQSKIVGMVKVNRSMIYFIDKALSLDVNPEYTIGV